MNSAEIGKACTLTAFWLSAIFLPVWGACWLVGVALPWVFTSSYCSFLGDAQELVAEICRALVPVAAIMVFIPINAMFMVLLERRALALFTVRKGPNRVGHDGWFQTAADAVKLLFKEDITPRGADALMFTLAPIIFFAPSIFGVLPLLTAVTNNHPLFQVVNLPTGIFYVLAASSVPVVGIVMGGWASNNKYSLVGGLRSAAQAISYEIPLVLSIVTVCLLAGTLDVVQIANQQVGGIQNWNLLGGGSLGALIKYFSMSGEQAQSFAQQAFPMGVGPAIAATIFLIPATIGLFALYATGACAEINRIPFDLPEAESELVSGYNTEYSGIKFAIFFLAEFTNLFVVSTIAVVMFLGGGSNPLPDAVVKPVVDAVGPPLHSALSVLIDQLHVINPETFWAAIWVIIKTYSIVFFAILIRGTLPRFRIDQLMDFGWKRLIPLSFILFVVVVFARVFVNAHFPI